MPPKNLKRICLHVNGADRYFIYEPGKDVLADVLRRHGLTGTKVGCRIGACGICSVILNGEVIRSCTKKMDSVPENSEILTIEGIGTPTHPHPLQQAWVTYGGVQCGFCSPGFIVSAKALLDQNPDPTRDEVRAWFQKHRNVCRCTGYKPLVDAVMAAAKVMRGEATMEEITFRLGEGEEPMGKPIIRPAAMAKACGVCDFGEDLMLKMPDGVYHLAVVQPRQYHHANILGIDTSEAEKMPGVVKVITAADVKGTNIIDISFVHKRSKVKNENWPVFADKKIFRYGAVVAAVAADTQEHAREAAKRVKVDLEPLPEYLNFVDAVMPDAVEIHEGTPNTYLLQPVLKGDEDTRDVIENSAYSIEARTYTTREPHMSLETDPVQAYFEPDGTLVVQCKTQNVYGAHAQIAPAVGVEPEKLRVIENPTGSSYGYATCAHSYAMVAACAVALDAPCVWTPTYEEHQHYTGKRAPSNINGRMACDENGIITALEADMGCDHGAYPESARGLSDRFARFIGFPYKIPNVTGLARMTTTNFSFGTSYRGFGSPQVETNLETMVDMLAEKAGIDPFEFRFRNIIRPGDLNINSRPYREYPWEGIFEKAKPIYEEMLARKAAATPEPGKVRGVGIACGAFSCSLGATDFATVYLELNPDGSVTHYGTWEDQGQGSDAGCVLFTAQALQEIGITPDKVRVVQSDSKTCPDSGVAGGSRSHLMSGNATYIAADKLMKNMRKDDGTYRTYDEMVAEGIDTKVEGTYSNAGLGLCNLDPNTGEGDPSPTCMYGLFLSEVEVDTNTGKTQVLSYITVDDIGTVGNPISVEGQCFGGASHCIGFALSEDYNDVKKHANIAGAGIPTIDMIPDKLEVYHVVTPRALGPSGAAGCSELYQSGGHMAVINAIYNACGVRIFELPAKPEKIKAGLEIIAAGGKVEPPAPYFMGSDLYDEIDEIKANPV